MSVNPETCSQLLTRDFILANSRARLRRGRLMRAVVGAAAALVLLGLVAIPLYLLAGLGADGALPAGAWAHVQVLLAGTLRAGACAVLVAVPLGLATALFTAHFCAPRLRAFVKIVLELLEALPTVVLGLVAAATVAPWLAQHVAGLLAAVVIVPALLLGAGMAFGRRVRTAGWLPLWLLPMVVAAVAVVVLVAARRPLPLLEVASPWNAVLVGLTLGMASVPLVFSIAEDALYLVPRTHTQAAFALGATRWQALTSVIVPAAGSGLLAAALLGLSRCLGETMIVLMASGNTPLAGANPLIGLRSLSADLALGLPDATPGGGAYRLLLLAALLLLVLTLGVNVLAEGLRARLRRRLRADAHA